MSRLRSLLLPVLLLGCAPFVRGQIAFDFGDTSGLDLNALAGFQKARARWEAQLSDPITVKIDIGYAALAPGVLAQAGAELEVIAYDDFKATMAADRTSANDFTAVASLPAGFMSGGFLSFNVLLNRTVESPGATPYTGLSSALAISRANARALGFITTGRDGAITFSSNSNWDFNPDDGIEAGKFDFVGAATHEIGHVLGFISGVDFLDQAEVTDLPLEADTYQTPIDMFRFSTGSSLIDGTADSRLKFFSINGGVTTLAEFSRGVVYGGDARQASHWGDDLGIGIMDPTASPGELMAISAMDLVAFDVMGYNLTSVPEPADVALWVSVVAAGAAVVRRRRKKTV